MKTMQPKRKSLGLALGADGARGLAHIGVLRAFEDGLIPITILVGSSIGVLVGGAFACGMDTYEIERKVEGVLKSPIFHNSGFKSIREIQATTRREGAEFVVRCVSARKYPTATGCLRQRMCMSARPTSKLGIVKDTCSKRRMW
jgi:hypothetical protein